MDLKEIYIKLIKSKRLNEVQALVDRNARILTFCPVGVDHVYSDLNANVGIPLENFIHQKRGTNDDITTEAINSDEIDEIIIYLIQEGCRNCVGGSEGRGGLMLAKRRGWEPFQYLVKNSCTSILRHLVQMSPPLLFPQDVIKYNLLDLSITMNSKIEMTKFLIELNPEAVYGKKGLTPIFRCSLHSTENDLRVLLPLLLDVGMKQQVGGEYGVGGLCVQSPGGQMPLDILFFQRRIVSPLTDLSRILKRSVETEPILQAMIINYTHKQMKNAQNCSKMIKHFCQCIRTKDSMGRLPLHHALELGLEWELVLRDLIYIDIETMEQKDPLTGLPPAALAAGSICTLSTLYKLIRHFPAQDCLRK